MLALGPPGRASAGFREVHGTAKVYQELRKAAPYSSGRASLRGQRALPGQAHLTHLVAGSAQLDEGQQLQQGPAVGRLSPTQLRRGPLQGLLEVAERMFDRVAMDI